MVMIKWKVFNRTILTPSLASVCSMESQHPPPHVGPGRESQDLKELCNKPLHILEVEEVSQPSGLVKDIVDVAPSMTSLASEVTHHLPPVNNKTNLLQSLPTTSRGKTMVEDIIMFQELVCYNRNMVFLLYISLVQEKTRSLTPLALEFPLGRIC